MASVIVHPLALLNISDYLKRLESIGQIEGGKLLIGGLLGKFNEKTGKYSIFITFEINNLKDLSNNLKLYKQIYSNLAFIGFYEYGNGNDRELDNDLEYTNVDLSDTGYCIEYQDMIILKLRNLSDFEVNYMDRLKDGVISVSIKVIKIENLVMNTINQVNNEYEEANKEYSTGLSIDNFKNSIIKLNYKINLIIEFLLSLSLDEYSNDNSNFNNFKINSIIKSINKINIDLKLINYKIKKVDDNDKRIIEYLILNQSIILNNYYKLDKLLSIEKEIE
ncbi:hypothetical protein BVG19_g870 [[Candida] boidinii]|nr:hypothetical protein BVG19_g870 [[Candida] boidinii]OWB48733.1 hypothetical protein B5S27_g268 [[Candida] boidinii]